MAHQPRLEEMAKNETNNACLFSHTCPNFSVRALFSDSAVAPELSDGNSATKANARHLITGKGQVRKQAGQSQETGWSKSGNRLARVKNHADVV